MKLNDILKDVFSEEEYTDWNFAARLRKQKAEKIKNFEMGTVLVGYDEPFVTSYEKGAIWLKLQKRDFLVIISGGDEWGERPLETHKMLDLNKIIEDYKKKGFRIIDIRKGEKYPLAKDMDVIRKPYLKSYR